MGYIYQITNQINGKRYIGATSRSIIKRWWEHKNDAKNKWDKVKNRPLYQDIVKYGSDNFVVEEIDRCDDVDLEEMERFYIFKFGTDKNGYNIAKGGKGKELIDIDNAVKLYKMYHRIDKVAEELHCDKGRLGELLKIYGIDVKPSVQILKESYGKRVNMFTTDKNFINSFESIREAATYIIKKRNLPTEQINGIAAHIGQVCNGKRHIAYGYTWQFVN